MASWPEIIQVLLVAAAPLSELRGAIPFAVLQHQMDPLSAYGWSVLGNLLPVPALLLGLGRLEALFRRWRWTERLIVWWFDRVQRRHQRALARWGPLALVFFVAIPFPVTGAWSGALVAYLFRIPLKHSLPLIGLGVLMAGALILGATLGVVHGIGF
jgi:uncharacterized membrane protein